MGGGGEVGGKDGRVKFGEIGFLSTSTSSSAPGPL